ncbi:Quinone oxidoreductase 1 [Nocardioides aquaticus]|uniref:Quinone oxidoreductase 1 n=1 Tax=Nocardioides aquaticus TaxID=160826 RepID=A0ABX8EFA0_9ACTN|nr:NAD(P)H-quinone oxidoreductase [Nocardioides aquaticus]QVT77768.1 Quinone oxidoreductase 1 [Nocardioides aquaticus]
MRAVVTDGTGGPEVLSVGEVEQPQAGPGEVLIEVRATAVNRADTLQRRGMYPPPKGASDVIGLECSGVVAALGPDGDGGPVTGAGGAPLAVGDEVCALLAGGGYAAYVVVPAGQVMPVPAGVDLVTAAALPEVACTVWSNLEMVAGLQQGETLLVHGGAGGIGTFAIQLAHHRGVRVVATAGSPEKLQTCRELGADVVVSYRDEDFVEVVRGLGGADVILDNMGASYLGRNVTALATEGRLVVIGMQGGAKGELDLGMLLGKRGSVSATSLRARPVEEKAAICAEVVAEVWPMVADGRIRPMVHGTMPLEEVRAAHELMEASGHTGKIVLTL